MIRQIALLAAMLVSIGSALAQPTQTLRIGLNEDGDILDPTIARTYVSRIIFMGLCDKLFDINEKLEIIPQLALSYEYVTPTELVLQLRPGVRFHGGARLDADAVVYTLNRHLNLPGSTRRAEISAMDRAVATGPLTVKITLKSPSAPFLSQLADRAGMIVSPRPAEAAGVNFGLNPFCTGPFRFTERIAQDRVVLDRFAQYWDAQNIHFARVIYRPITDTAVKFANLQAGSLDFASALVAQTRGDLEATAIGWSGRIDPAGNIYNALSSSGPLNASHYSNKDVDAWLDQARLSADLPTRRALYAKITSQISRDMPNMCLYATAMIMGMSTKITGFRPVPDGLVRLQGLRLAP